MSKQEELKLIISAVDQATTAIKGVGDSVNWLGGTVTKASMQFNAIGQAAQAAFQGINAAFKQVVDAVEGFNLAVIQSAALVTGMMVNDDRSLADRYKEAKEYATALQKVLEQIDKDTLLTARDLGTMTMEMQKQNVLLDVTNQKQIEAFTTIANAVAVISTGYPNKEVQIRQEIRALLQGQARSTDALGSMLKAQIPDLERQIALHKEQGDLIEYLASALQGFSAATEDINGTWEAMKTTFETIARQTLRGAMSEAFSEMLQVMKKISEWVTENKEQIAEELGRAWGIIRGLLIGVWDILVIMTPVWEVIGGIVRDIFRAVEWIATVGLPKWVDSLRLAVKDAADLFRWMGKIFEGAGDGDYGGVMPYTPPETPGATQADFQNLDGGKVPSTPKTKKIPNEDMLKKQEEWRKVKLQLESALLKEEADSTYWKKVTEIEQKYRSIMEDKKWQGVPGIKSYMETWRKGMLDENEKDFEKKSYANAVKIASEVEKQLVEEAVRTLQSLKENSDQYYQEEMEMANRRYQRAEISEQQMVDRQLELAEERKDAELEYQSALEIRYGRGELAWEKYNQLIRQSDKELAKLKLSIEDLAYKSQELSTGFEGGWMKGWEQYGQDLNNMYRRGVDSATQAAKGMEGAFKTFFFDVMTLNFKSFGDLMTKFVKSMTDVFANFLSTELSKMVMGSGSGGFGMIGSLLGKLGGFIGLGEGETTTAAVSTAAGYGGGYFTPFTAMSFHSGGIVGLTRPGWATVNPAVFNNAPRLHGGLAADEFPAVLQTGEAVIPRGGVGGSSTYIVINAVDSKSFDDMCRRNPNAIVKQATKALQNNQTRSQWNSYLR